MVITFGLNWGVSDWLGAVNTVKEFDVHVTMHRDNFLIIKPTRCTNFSNLFCNETLHVSDSSSVHDQELFTVGTAMVYVIQVMLTARKLCTNLYDINHCCVYGEKLLMMDRGTV
jgi:hypothetical protein